MRIPYTIFVVVRAPLNWSLLGKSLILTNQHEIYEGRPIVMDGIQSYSMCG
jgi:hypothetical protein